MLYLLTCIISGWIQLAHHGCFPEQNQENFFQFISPKPEAYQPSVKWYSAYWCKHIHSTHTPGFCQVMLHFMVLCYISVFPKDFLMIRHDPVIQFDIWITQMLASGFCYDLLGVMLLGSMLLGRGFIHRKIFDKTSSIKSFSPYPSIHCSSSIP